MTLGASGADAPDLQQRRQNSASLLSVTQGSAAIFAPITLTGSLDVSPSADSTLAINSNIGQTAVSSLTLNDPAR